MSRGVRLLIVFLAGALLLVGVGVVAAAHKSGSGSEAQQTPPGAAQELLNPHPIAGSFKPDTTKLASCKDRGCFEQAFGNIAYYDGPKPALRVFDRMMLQNNEVETDCHRIAHMIGSASLAHFKGDVPRAFTAGSASCNSGYYHGILERALVGVTTTADLIRRVRGLCAGGQIRTSRFIAYQCVHGLGHGLMIFSGLDLPYSLKMCEKLQTQWDQTSCDGGVFMENQNSSYGIRSRFLKTNDPVYPCDAVATRHKLYCYLMVTSQILRTNGYDWAATAEACARVEDGWKDICFESYGRDASGVARRDFRALRRYCDIPAPRWRSECIYGAVRDIANNDAAATRAGQFCDGVTVSLRGRCFNGAGSIIADLAGTPARQRSMCTAITTRYLSACLLRTYR